MAKRHASVPLIVLGLLGCHRLVNRHAPDASPVATVDAAAPVASAPPQETTPADEAEEERTPADADAGGACPLPVHPGYCRRACKGYQARATSKHARRVAHSARAGLGTCGAFKVFAEDEQAGDAGVTSGIVEYFDAEGVLVAAVDTRSQPCGRFGQVPSCTPKIAWERGKTVTVRVGETTVNGKLPHEVIERILRQNIGRFRLCFTNSTGSRPTVEGRVVVKFVIGNDGTVSSVQDGGSDFAAEDVKTCVVHAFSTLSFPQPEGGPVSVTAPLIFAP